MSKRSLLVLWLRRGLPLLLGLLAGCERTPAEEQARTVWGAYCDQLRRCSFNGFYAVFGDYPGCVRRGVDGLDPGATAAPCTPGELDACVQAIGASRCPNLDDWSGPVLDSRKLPEPCARCSPPGPAVTEADAGADAP